MLMKRLLHHKHSEAASVVVVVVVVVIHHSVALLFLNLFVGLDHALNMFSMRQSEYACVCNVCIKENLVYYWRASRDATKNGFYRQVNVIEHCVVVWVVMSLGFLPGNKNNGKIM